MKIGVLSRKSSLVSTRRLMEAGSQRGHEMHVINYLGCYMSIASSNPAIHYQGEALTGFDAVIPRIGATYTFYGTAIVRQFEMMGVFPLNPSQAILRSRDKLRSFQLLARKGIGLPITGFARNIKDIDDLIAMVGGAPLIIKLLEGTQGLGVVLAETKKAAESVIQAFYGLKSNILVQEYIKESAGTDIRAFVIGDKVVASIQRKAKEGEFRSNVHRGGTPTEVKLSPEERKMAVKASKSLGLRVAGVDIIRANRGPVIMEVNSSPGLEGIEKTTGKDIAGKVIQFIEKNAKPGASRDRITG